jgi:hypothetical protein
MKEARGNRVILVDGALLLPIIIARAHPIFEMVETI